jgi:hypothetical protein
MPLLRRPHDHCRKLRARRRTSRSAVTPSQQRHCHVMTPVTASPHIPPAEEPRFRRCIAVAPPSPKAHAASSIRPKSPPRPLPQRQNRYCNPRFAADHGSQRISHPSRRTAFGPIAHSGNLSPNIGRPLTDASFVTSSWITSQCSASWPFSRRTISTTIQFAGRPKPLNRPWRST